jgi:hypothetical protein
MESEFMTRESRPPAGSNLGRAWTELRRDRDRAVSIAKDAVALLNDMNKQGEIPARFELTIDSFLVRLANLLGAERTPRRIADVGEKQDAIPSGASAPGGPAHNIAQQSQLVASLGSQHPGDSDSGTDCLGTTLTTDTSNKENHS